MKLQHSIDGGVDHPSFFIDRNLSDDDLISALRGFGFNVISHFEHYTQEKTPNPQSVPDEEIIPECALNGWVLVTADGRLEHRHFGVIKTKGGAIFIVPNNDKSSRRWAEVMVEWRAQIYRCVKHYRIPFVARLNGTGVYQLKCLSERDQTPADCAILIKDGKTDHECARKHRKKAG